MKVRRKALNATVHKAREGGWVFIMKKNKEVVKSNGAYAFFKILAIILYLNLTHQHFKTSKLQNFVKKKLQSENFLNLVQTFFYFFFYFKPFIFLRLFSQLFQDGRTGTF